MRKAGEQVALSADPAERTRLYREAQRIAFDDGHFDHFGRFGHDR